MSLLGRLSSIMPAPGESELQAGFDASPEMSLRDQRRPNAILLIYNDPVAPSSADGLGWTLTAWRGAELPLVGGPRRARCRSAGGGSGGQGGGSQGAARSGRSRRGLVGGHRAARRGCTGRSWAPEPPVPRSSSRWRAGPGRCRRLAQTVGTVPPSITYSAPTIAEARSETRNPTRSAISSVFANRPRGTPPRES